MLHGRAALRPLGARQLLSTQTRGSGLTILEVGPRDGLQNIPVNVPTAIKIELIERLASTGLRDIEAASFVSSKRVPQMADGHAVMAEATRTAARYSLRLPVLAPNMKGLKNAVSAGATDVEVFASATEAFSKANQNCTVDEALVAAESVAKHAVSQNVAVRGVISCIFSDPISGPTPPEEVLRVVKRLLAMGCYEVGLGDTLGVGTAKKTRALLDVMLNEIPADKLAAHFHDTYGQATANVMAAYDMGIRSFDASVAGLGGCPYAKGAKGNLATEDLIYFFEESGIDTGVNLVKLSQVGQWITKQLGLPNSSRAGAAIVAKTEIAQQRHNQHLETRTQRTESRVWSSIDHVEGLKVERCGSAVKISLDRPRKGNSMTKTMLDSLTRTIQRLAVDRSVFHILLTASGKFFCTGMDFGGDTDRISEESDYYGSVRDVFQAIEDSPQTTIALVNGPAFGGGVGLTYACDVRIAARKASFTLSEIKLGLQPAVISRFMAREWGFSFFREAMLSGREVSADELFRIGAIHRLVDSDVDSDLEQAGDEYLNLLQACAPSSAAECKELVKLAWSQAGHVKQDEFIEDKFCSMMLPGSEGEHGIAQFQKKLLPVDWTKFWEVKGSHA